MNENLIKLYDILSILNGEDLEKRKIAENELEIEKKKKKKDFLFNLLEIFHNQTIDLQIRRLAGLVLKNQIEQKNFQTLSNEQNWSNIYDENMRIQFKQILLNDLNSSSKIIRRTGSQILAKIAFIELNNKLWESIFEDFFHYLFSRPAVFYFYEGILETIDFLFQEFFDGSKIFDIFRLNIKVIFEIILTPIRDKNYGEEQLILISLKTLYTSLHFIDLKKLEESDFDLIFSLVINQVTNSCLASRVLAFEILEIMTKQYYDRIDRFISLIFDLTLITLEQDTDEVGFKAIEFWSTLADQEFQINVDSILALSEGTVPNCYSKKFIIKSGSILPFILLTFIENKKILDNEDWDGKSIVGSCLNLMIQAGPNEILPNVIEFIENKINVNSETRSKNTAVFSLIAIFDGIGSKMLYNHLFKTTFLWLSFSENDNLELKQATFFLFGKILQTSPFVLRASLDQILNTILKSVSEKKNKIDIYWILNEIFQSFEPEGLLEWHLETMCSIIFNLISQSISEGNIIHELFEIICSVILNSSIRSQSCLFLLMPSMFVALRSSFLVDSFKLSETKTVIQSHLFRFLGSSIQRFGKQFSSDFISKIVELVFIIINMTKKPNGEQDLEDEIIIFIGAVIQVFKKESDKLVINVASIIFEYFQKNIEHQTMAVAIGILGDICSSYLNLNGSFIKKSTFTLIELLQDERTNSETKPLILSCLGDLSFASGKDICDFQNMVIPIIKSTFESIFKHEKYFEQDTFDWILSIKESLLEILTGLVQSDPDNLLANKLFKIDTESCWLITSLYKIISEDRIQRTTKLCIGLIGDYGANCKSQKKKLAKCSWIKQLVYESIADSCPTTNFMGSWASESIYGI